MMLVGEMPGDREDVKGEPFVGPAGALLDKALADAGLNVAVARRHGRPGGQADRRARRAEHGPPAH